MAQGVKNINHAQFVDDTILLGGTSTNSTRRFKSMLDSYYKVSGNFLNYRKSQIYSWNINPREIIDISRILGIEGTTL